MRPMLGRATRLYGAHPLQLVLVLASFVLAAYAVLTLGVRALFDPDVWWQSIAVWFVGAALAHDLILFPLYAAVDRIVQAITSRRRRTRTRLSKDRSLLTNDAVEVPAINFVRVPLMAVGLITLMFFPGLIEQGSGAYVRATGQTQSPFLLRWAILCAAIVLVGALAYLFARARSRRHAPAQQPGHHPVRHPTTPGMSAQDATGSPNAAETPPAPGWALAIAVALVVVVATSRRRQVNPDS